MKDDSSAISSACITQKKLLDCSNSYAINNFVMVTFKNIVIG